MSLTYCGTATIDKQLGLRNSDEAFFDFMGKDIYGSVIDFIFREDEARFLAAFDEVINGRILTNLVMVRRKSSNPTGEWLLIEMTVEPFRVNGEQIVRLKFYAYKIAKTDENDAEQSKSVYELFFGLLGATMLTYDRNNDVLDITAGMDGATITLYHGTLERWQNEFMKGRVDGESSELFESLCNKLNTGDGVFGADIKTSVFSEDNTMSLYSFKCRVLNKDEDNQFVLGSISAMESTTVSSASTGYVMDAGLPCLSKRSIIEYAKSAFLKNQERTYIVVLDLDDFKTINDTYGHLFGDEVLLRLVKIVKDSIGKSGMLGRIGGDEFMIVLNWVESQVELRNILRSIRTGVEWAYKGERDDIRLSCSIGCAAYPDNGDSYDKVFQLADKMVYIAKSKGKNRYVIYTPEIHDVSISSAKQSASGSTRSELKNDKIGVMTRLLEEFMVRKIVLFEEEFRDISACFELDKIQMIYSKFKEAITLDGDEFTNVIDENVYLELEDGFRDGFDKDKLIVMNGRFNIEHKAPKLAKLLESQGVESAIFYKMEKSGKMFGYVMFAKKSRRQQWSEYEKTFLACAAKAFELSFTGK